MESIKLHNQFEIPVEINASVRLHSNILRDTDKLDIFRVIIEYFETRKYRGKSGNGRKFT